jgi:hypothetical protein
MILFKMDKASNLMWVTMNFSIIILPTILSITYPKVGSILGYIGAIAGFFSIYTIPTVTHLKMERIKIENPLLFEAL